ncbi:hypothetical protein [Romboutsia timonensis]|uniref:hypothetical protein n=1 Tax=Romboutsia timonensis TaxID=1776391 RepID=UPI0023F8CB22|nr:hypothetical protein [Romboutsia timonensis]
MTTLKLNTVARLSENYMKVEFQEELIQIIREGIYNMNQKALINKFVLRTFEGNGCEHQYVVLANSGLTNNFEYMNKNGEVEIFGINVEFGPDKLVNYTEDLLSVDFGKGKNNIAKTINYVKKSGLYVNLNTKKCYFVISSNAITDGVEMITDKNQIRSILSSCTLYKGYSWSNSEERNLRATLVNASKYSAKERIEKLDKQLGGSLKYWMSRSLDFKAIQKLATRNGLQNPGALFIGEFGNEEWGALFLKKKISGNSDTTKEYADYLEERGIELDDYIIDGQHVKNAAWLVDVLYKHHNIETTEDVVAGIMEQERSVGAGNKSAGCYEYADVFNAIVDYLKANYQYTIIGNPKRIAVIHDTNSAKIPNYDGNGFRSMILDVATASAQAVTSGQLLSKLMFLDKDRTVNFLYNKMYNNLIDMVDITATESEFSTTGSLSQVLFGLNPEMARTDIYALQALGQDLMKYAKGAITKTRVKVKGSNYRAQFDNSFMLLNNKEGRILGTTANGYIECYNSDVIAKNRREIRTIEREYKKNLKTMSIEEARAIRTAALDKCMTGLALKYPCPGNSEFEIFRFLTNMEIEERCFETNADVAQADRLYRYFTTKSGGCIVIAPENILKHKLAGMDTDFDGLTVILEQDLVSIATDAYKAGTITGDASIPSYTVILNKIKDNSSNYHIVDKCIKLTYRQDIDKEIENIKTLNNIIG